MGFFERCSQNDVCPNVILNVVKYPKLRSPHRLNVILNVVKHPIIRSPRSLPWDSSSVALRMTVGGTSVAILPLTRQNDGKTGIFALRTDFKNGAKKHSRGSVFLYCVVIR